MKKNFIVYIIAGEPSGDFIGSRLINKLKLLNSNIKIVGVGGNLMQKEGLKSLFDIKSISVMGILEIIPKLFKIFKLIKLTVRDIKSTNPDLLITIDSPGFNLRVVNLLKKSLNHQIKCLHYVAPTVWAYKPQRAKKFAKTFNYLFCLLPFEPPYFEKEGIKTFFVGHPIVESSIVSFLQHSDVHMNNLKKSTFDGTNNVFTKTNSNILLLPGSRVAEIRTLLPIFLKAASIIKCYYPQLKIVIVTIPDVVDLVQQLSLNYSVTIVTHEMFKYENFLESTIALAASGTVTLELALANIRTIVAYKFNLITSVIVYFLIKIKYISLINIMANKIIFPEILGPKCTSKRLANEALKFMNNDLDSKTVYNILYNLGYNNFIPSTRAAELIVNILEKKI